MKRFVAVLLAGAVLFAACGDEATDGAAEAPPESTISDGLPPADDDATIPVGMGPGISVAEALESTLDGPLLVNGFLFVFADGSVVLADVMAESFPPQPGGATIAVEGLDLMQIPLTEGPTDAEIEITGWTDLPIQVLGDIVDGVLVGTSTASA